MTEKATQIINKLHEGFPELAFKWENNLWPLGDSSPCSLVVWYPSNPDKKDWFLISINKLLT